MPEDVVEEVVLPLVGARPVRPEARMQHFVRSSVPSRLPAAVCFPHLSWYHVHIDNCLAHQNNVIIKHALEPTRLVEIVAHFCRRCIDRYDNDPLKAVVLSTLRSDVERLHHDAVRCTWGLGGLRVRTVFAPSVDTWQQGEWQSMLGQIDVVFTTPALFHDAVRFRHLRMDQLSCLVFTDMSHCVGRCGPHSHPYKQLLNDQVPHPITLSPLRVLAVGRQLASGRIQTPEARDTAKLALEKRLCCRLLDTTEEPHRQTWWSLSFKR